MSRLTQAKMERWQRDIDKSLALLWKLHSDVRAVKLAAKGGRLSRLQRISAQVADLSHETTLLRGDVEELQDVETKRKVPS